MTYREIVEIQLNITKSALVLIIFPLQLKFLCHLAYKFYKNPNYWWVLANANDIKGTMYAEIGIQLRIPKDLAYILSEFNRLNGI